MHTDSLNRIIGVGANLRKSDNAIIVSAGWDSDATLEGSVLVKGTPTKLKNVRIQVEFRGFCETRWETNIKLATQSESTSYPIIQSSKVFQQLVDVAFDGKIELLGEMQSYPFSFKLPRNGLPPSFESVSGAVQHYLKVSMLYQEGMKLLKSSVDCEASGITMPESARQKLLEAPSQMTHQVVSSS
ncbi:UNVERIFIED_CONTAM: hypothetical protein HDU68_010226 [Siphonaria sp. JEL0065]|nr:hypothetical protein HDU68_010226 [Siphonaria sp. JEL0065]